MAADRAVTHASATNHREDAGLFLIVAVLGLALSYFFAFVAGVFMSDALTRTYDAASVIYSNSPRLANIGFIWNPLPALAQMPFLLIRPLGANGFSGQIVSVGFGAGGLVVFNRLIRLFWPQRRWRYSLLAVYQLNPMILLYTVNGMSESALLFWVLLSAYSLTKVAQRSGRVPTGYVALTGVAASMAFMTRYEGVVFGLVLGATLLVLTLTLNRAGLTHAGALLVTFAAPWAYAIGFWLLMNWMMMGNPLYFMVGRGSNRDEAADLIAHNAQMAALYHSLPNALGYVANLLGHLFPAFFPVVALLLLLAFSKRDRYALALVGLGSAFPAFQVAMHYAGQSFGFLRFHIYVIPFTVLGAAYLTRQMSARTLWRPAVLGLLLLSSVSAAFAAGAPNTQEAGYFEGLVGKPSENAHLADRGMADYLRALIRREPHTRILVDVLHDGLVIVFTGDFQNFIGDRDERFTQALAHPAGQVDYILMPLNENDPSDPVAKAASAAKAAGSLELAYELRGAQADGWELYRVVAPVRPLSGPSASHHGPAHAP